MGSQVKKNRSGDETLLVSLSGGNSKAPSSYTGEITFTTVGIAVPLATGTESVSLTNIDGINFGRFAFGESAPDALANAATGKRLFPMSAASQSRAHLDMKAPPKSTHIAGIADTGNILVDVQQEV